MTQAIGFAKKFYTLWSLDKQPKYITNSYGVHHLVGYDIRYTYHKNISFDLEKAKNLHPNLELYEDLRGKTKSWTKLSKEDLCPNIMKFGKYYGQDLNQLVTDDFNYVLWVAKNSTASNGTFANSLPQVQQYFTEQENEVDKILKTKTDNFNAVLKEGYFEFVAEKNLSIYEDTANLNYLRDELFIRFKFPAHLFKVNYYQGFTFGLPIVKGKGKRIKGKRIGLQFIPKELEEPFTVEVTEVFIR